MDKLYTRRDLLAILAGGSLAGIATAVKGSMQARKRNLVVSCRHPGPEQLDFGMFSSLIDRSILELTGAKYASDAWTSLFSQEDHVSIKVNCLGGPAMSTSWPLAMAVAERLEKCGIKPHRIIIWDRSSRELKEAGYELSKGGSGIQCYGTDEVGYSNSLIERGSVASLFSRILTDRCNKVVNIPILKDHGICGLTFAMKNYFGAVHNPNKYHLNKCNPYIGDLNSMRLIRDKEALIIGDLSRIQADGGPSYKNRWTFPFRGVIIGRDPVALDSVALEILQYARKKLGRPDLRAKGLHPDYIEAAARAGAGSTDGLEHIELST